MQCGSEGLTDRVWVRTVATPGVTEGQYLTAFLFLTKPLLPVGFWNSEAGACARCSVLHLLPAACSVSRFDVVPGAMSGLYPTTDPRLSFGLQSLASRSTKSCAAASCWPPAP